MDELLRAYAQKRREQAGPAAELHPATRKLLQDEIKRAFSAASKPASTRQNWRFWRWPLLAMWSGMAALLVMFAMLNAQFRSLAPSNSKEEGRLKKGEDNGSAVVSTAPAGVPPTGPAPVLAGNVASAPSAPSPVLQNLEYADAPRRDSSALAASAPAGRSSRLGRPAAATPRSSGASNGADVAAENFVQVHDRNRAGAAPLPPSNLLSNFRMLRSGQNVSVVDADGSVYKGLVLDGVSNLPGFGGGGMRQQAKAPQNILAETNWTFSVTGVNNSLRQNISFTGNVLDMKPGGALNGNAAQNRNASPSPPAPTSRITGKVQVNGGQPFEIEAKPPSP